MILEIVKARPWDKDPFYVRRRPDYSSNTPARIAHRLKFAKAAYEAYGEDGFTDDGMPVVAAQVQEKLLEAKPEPVELPELKIIRQGCKLIVTKIEKKEECSPNC